MKITELEIKILACTVTRLVLKKTAFFCVGEYAEYGPFDQQICTVPSMAYC